VSGTEPVVSIITPTFNHERYIRQCLESAIAQTDPRWEQLVIDDGSDDDTEAIIRSIDDPRIRYTRRDHLGIMHLAASYNMALQMARGEFVAVLEGDDFWPANKIERQLPLFDRPEIVLAWGRAGLVSEGGELERTAPKPTFIARMQGRTQGETIRSLLTTNFIPAGTVMCRRDALLRMGGFQQPDGIVTTDYPTWLAMCRAGTFASANEVLGFHRRHGDSAGHSNKAQMSLVLDWGARFVERLPDDERAALGLTVDEAHHVERRRGAYLDYGTGRTALEAGRVREARALFRNGLRGGSRTTRLKAAFALMCSYLGLDLEQIARVGHRVLGR
jgi:glycosyltransferase involved in cell wall biosynthesis